MKVLIAEDDLTSRVLFERMIQLWGYETIATQNGKEAWTVLQSITHPTIAILDWIMPEMDGIDVCRNLQTLRSKVPIYTILLTSRNRQEDKIAGFDAGFDDFIAKPFDHDELRVRIRVGERVVRLQSALAKRILELEQAFKEIDTLQGILPMCMFCHKIRNDEEIWERIEEYITQHSNAKFSHGMCPECAEKHYGGYVSTRVAKG